MGIQTSIKELCGIILKIAGKDYEIQFEPTGQTFVTNRVGSTDKAKNDLGFEAKISLEQGLRSLIEWRRGETNKENSDHRQGAI
jgi:UDP-glucose 4-epimerase